MTLLAKYNSVSFTYIIIKETRTEPCGTPPVILKISVIYLVRLLVIPICIVFLYHSVAFIYIILNETRTEPCGTLPVILKIRIIYLKSRWFPTASHYIQYFSASTMRFYSI